MRPLGTAQRMRVKRAHLQGPSSLSLPCVAIVDTALDEAGTLGCHLVSVRRPGLGGWNGLGEKDRHQDTKALMNSAATVSLDSIRWLGRGVLRTVRGTGRMGVFLAETLLMTFVPPYRWRRVLERIHFLGVKTTFVILLTGVFAGMVLGLQTFYVLGKFGAESLLGPAVALSLVRELGPVLSALMIAGRAGSALTAELGVMRISEQIDALDMMAIHPVQYLVVPNLLASIAVFPVLTWFFDVVGIFGGYLVGVKLLGLAHGTYFGEIHTFLDIQDVLDGLYKSLCFGIVVIWICSYKGYYAGHGAEGVSRATTEAVVLSSVSVLLWDYLMGSFLF